jgi:23S rRNA (cytidine1920-2'-O)/16S rRNA (cytidine1409-2'-O)-methyltransferase
MAKIRLDVLLVERGLAESRALAQRLVLAGQVRINGQVALKPAQSVSPEAEVSVDHGPPFVSRGGEKLAGALQAFGVAPTGWVCADVGASTGGFSDCLLQNGAAKVYAIDVGKGILHWKLRQDKRVVVMEETNARYVERLPELVRLVVIDASFISLKLLLPVVRPWLLPEGEVIALIKPQFEVGKAQAARGDGVIRDPEAHRAVLQDILSYAQANAWSVAGLIRSPLLGPKGNTEFLVWLKQDGPDVELANLIDAALMVSPEAPAE